MPFPKTRSPNTGRCTILSGMKYWFFLIALATTTAPAFAVICKTIDADGVVTYSEVPAAECPQKVTLPDYSRYAPRPIEPIDSGEAESQAPREAEFQGYRTAKIQQPEQDETVRSNEGLVPVTVMLEPPLQPGHRVVLYVDGQAIPGAYDSEAVQLSGIPRGVHQLQAAVIDTAGARLTSTPAMTFTLRQTGLLDGAGRPTLPLPRPR